MITDKQFKIFEVFAKKPFAELTRKEIKNKSKENSNNALALTINLLKREDVVLERVIGRSGILSLNLYTDRTFYYIALCNDRIIEGDVKYSIEILKKELLEETPFYSIVIFGSYATGNQKKTSDLDIAIIIDNEKINKKMEALANNASLKSRLQMDIHVISRQEMIKMLTNKEENLGKQIARKHMAVYNHRIFYEIIKEGILNGFRI